VSDQEKKAFDELRKSTGYATITLEEVFLAGRSSALNELEQVAREAFERAWNKRSDWSSPHYTHPGADDFERAFQDYWQKETESEEKE